MKLHRLLPVLVLLAAAACTRTAPPTALLATDTGQPPTAAAATDTVAPDTPTATEAAASLAAPTSEASATETGPATATAAATDTQAPTEASTATPAPSPKVVPPAESPTPTATLPPSAIIGQHTVQAGETLFCIARGYGVLPAAIAQANGLNEALFIFPGQVLKIPATPWPDMVAGPVCAPQFASPFTGAAVTPLPSPTLPAVQPTVTPVPFTPLPPSGILGQHIVQPGETVFCIGRGYGVLPAAIAQANGLGAALVIVPGQTLNIPAVQWMDIVPGPVCPPQFASPYPGPPTSQPN